MIPADNSLFKSQHLNQQKIIETQQLLDRIEERLRGYGTQYNNYTYEIPKQLFPDQEDQSAKQSVLSTQHGSRLEVEARRSAHKGAEPGRIRRTQKRSQAASSLSYVQSDMFQQPGEEDRMDILEQISPNRKQNQQEEQQRIQTKSLVEENRILKEKHHLLQALVEDYKERYENERSVNAQRMQESLRQIEADKSEIEKIYSTKYQQLTRENLALQEKQGDSEQEIALLREENKLLHHKYQKLMALYNQNFQVLQPRDLGVQQEIEQQQQEQQEQEDLQQFPLEDQISREIQYSSKKHANDAENMQDLVRKVQYLEHQNQEMITALAGIIGQETSSQGQATTKSLRSGQDFKHQIQKIKKNLLRSDDDSENNKEMQYRNSFQHPIGKKNKNNAIKIPSSPPHSVCVSGAKKRQFR